MKLDCFAYGETIPNDFLAVDLSSQPSLNSWSAIACTVKACIKFLHERPFTFDDSGSNVCVSKKIKASFPQGVGLSVFSATVLQVCSG